MICVVYVIVYSLVAEAVRAMEKNWCECMRRLYVYQSGGTPSFVKPERNLRGKGIESDLKSVTKDANNETCDWHSSCFRTIGIQRGTKGFGDHCTQ
jgi:hypothetical protein